METKYANDPRFSFLFQSHSRGAEYYRARLLFEQQQQCFAPHALRPAKDRRKILTAQSPRPKPNDETPKKKTPRRKAPQSTPRTPASAQRRTPVRSTPKVNIEQENERQKQQDERAAAARKKQMEKRQAEAAKIAETERLAGEKKAKRKAELEAKAAKRKEAEDAAKQKKARAAERQAKKAEEHEMRGGGNEEAEDPVPKSPRYERNGSVDFDQLKTKKAEANTTLHVGGIQGDLEDEAALEDLFSEYGAVDTVTLRIRREGTKVSWALVTFADAAGVAAAVGAARSLKKQGLVVRPVDLAQAKRSTGAMKTVMTKHVSNVDAAAEQTMELFHVDEGRLAQMEQRYFAAVTMQAHWRGKLARERVLGMIDVGESDEEEAENISTGRWSRVHFLEAVPLMKGMSHTELRRIADAMASEHYEDEEIFEQGEEGDSMYIVKEGICIVRPPTQRKQLFVARAFVCRSFRLVTRCSETP